MSGSIGYNPITRVNVTQQVGAQPSVLQRTGAFVSQGATTLTVGTYSLLTQPSSLTPILAGSAAITSATWTTNLVTVTTAAPHGITIGDTVEVTLTGFVPAGYNGTVQATATTATAFTYPLTTNPGTTTTVGVYTLEDVAELVQMNTTYWAQGRGNGVYVLELGPGNAADGIVALQAWIVANPGVFYSYLVPRPWGIEPTFFPFASNYTSDTAKTYFHLTTTLAYWQANPTLFAATLKSVIVTIEAPSIPTTEFSAAAGFYVTLNLNPSSSNRVTQAAFSFLVGVTPYPVMGNSSLFVTLAAANINIVGTGAEGGISNTIWLYGTTLDGEDFNKYWFSIDNVQINLDLFTSNAVINGSNNRLAPLDYNQAGINTLQAVAVSTMKTEVGYGLALGSVIATQLSAADLAEALGNNTYSGQILVNAEPFSPYVQENPSDYTDRIYQGLTVVYTIQNGFREIVYNVNVANFVS